MSVINKIIGGLCALGAGMTYSAVSAEVVVVMSSKAAGCILTVDQAAEIFLGRSLTLPGGARIVPVDQNDGSPARDEFYNKASGKSAGQLRAYWSKQTFTGKGRPPKEAGDDAGVKAMIDKNPTYIGYIDKAAVDARVKVLVSIK